MPEMDDEQKRRLAAYLMGDVQMPQPLPIMPVEPPPEEIQAPVMRTIAPSVTEQRYLDLAQQMPEREQYAHPGKLARLGAILSGVGASIHEGPTAGVSLTKRILEDPYKQAMQGWSSKMQALKPAVEMEMERSRLGMSQYGHDITIFHSLLQNAQQAATIAERRQYHKQLQEHYNALDANSKLRLERTLTFDQRQNLQNALQDKIEKRELKVGAARHGQRMSEIGAQQAGATTRQSMRDKAAMERAQLRGDKSPTEKQRFENEYFGSRRLLATHPEYATFMTMPEKPGEVFAVKSFSDLQNEGAFNDIAKNLRKANPQLTPDAALQQAHQMYFDYRDSLGTLTGEEATFEEEDEAPDDFEEEMQ